MGREQQEQPPAAGGAAADGGRPVPRHGRAALLRLAAWFEEAGPDRAHELCTAAFAAYSARHLQGRGEDPVPATASWWQAAPDRTSAEPAACTALPARVRDHRDQQARLRNTAESSAHWRRSGAGEIRGLLNEATGARARLRLSGAGMEVLMELLTAALGSGDVTRHPVSAGDLEFALRLHVRAAPGALIAIRCDGGELALEDLRLQATPYEVHTPQERPETSAAEEDPGLRPTRPADLAERRAWG